MCILHNIIHQESRCASLVHSSWRTSKEHTEDFRLQTLLHRSFCFYSFTERNVHKCMIYCHRKILASDLVYIRVIPRVCQDVKTCVNIVEQVDYLDGSLGRGVLAAEGIESYDATEEDGHVVIAFRRDRPFVPQLVGNRWRQNGIEQSKRKKRNETNILSKRVVMVYLSGRVMGWCCQTGVHPLDQNFICSPTTFWSFRYASCSQMGVCCFYGNWLDHGCPLKAKYLPCCIIIWGHMIHTEQITVTTQKSIHANRVYLPRGWDYACLSVTSLTVHIWGVVFFS